MTFVQNVPEHFVRPPTTVDQLLAAATQTCPPLPAPVLASRPPAPLHSRPLQQLNGAAALAAMALRCVLDLI